MPSDIARELKLTALTPLENSSGGTDGEVKRLCLEALAAMPEEAAAMKNGNQGVVNKLLGRVMRDSRGRVDARAAKEELKKLVLQLPSSPDV